MNPFYALNKTLDDIRNEPTEQQKALVESQVPKSPAKKTLEEALRTDLRSLMEDATGGMSGSNTLEAKDKSLSKAAKTIKKGALHKQEGIPKDKKIGDKKLNSLKKSGTPLEKKRANFALNIQGKGKKKVNEWETDPDEKEAEMLEAWHDAVVNELEFYDIKLPVPPGQISKIADRICNDFEGEGCNPAIIEKIIAGMNDQYMHDNESSSEEDICTSCNGSGEGQYDGTRCSSCRGKGVVFTGGDDYDDYDDYNEPDEPEYYENVNELSKGTLQAYKDKVSRGKVIGNHNGWTQIAPGHYPPTSGKRLAGYNKATDKIAKKDKQTDDFEAWLAQRDNENVNELSKGAVVGYKTGAQQDLRKLKQQPVDDFVSNMRQGHRIGDAANMAVQTNLKAIKKAKNRGAGIDRANARLGEEYASEDADQVRFKSGDRVLYMNTFATVIKCDGETCGIKIDHTPGTMMVPVSQIKKPSYDESVDEGATPDQLDQQKIAQMKRAAATRKNSRAVQQQPAQGGPRRSEVPAFIRKGRGDPGLDHNDLEETDMHSESDKDILDYLKAKLAPTGGNAKAKSRPYNGSAGDADAYNGMEFEEAESKFDKREVSPGRTQYTRKYDPDTGHSIGSETGGSAPAGVPGKRGRQAGSKFANGYAARHSGSHVSKAKMDSRKKDMDEDEYSRHTASKSPAGGTVYTRKYDPDTGHSIGTDTGGSAPASDGPRKRGRQPGTKFSNGYAARHDGSHVSKAKMNSRKKDMDEGSATCPHCGHAMADEGREVDMEGVKGGMSHFVKAAKKVAGVASAVKKAKKDYDGDGKIETGPEEHAGSVDKAIKANKAKPKAKSPAKPAAKPAKKTEEGKGDGNLANNAKPYDKVTQGDVIAGRLGKDEEGGKKKVKKEKKVEETTTSGSVSTSPAKKSSGGSGVGQGIYDSWERKYESLLKEDVNVTTNSSKNDQGEEEEHITIDVSGDDVARIKEMLHSMGVSHGDEAGHEHGGEEACDSCGGVPCQCDEMDEAKQHDPDYEQDDDYDGNVDDVDDGPQDYYNSDERTRSDQFEDGMEETTSFKDAGATVGRIGGTIAGGLGGAAAGLGIGTVPGAVAGGIAGGSAGSALGTAAGRWLDKKTGAPEETDEDMSGHQRMMELAGLGEANITVSDNAPDYPSNQEYSNDEMQYSGGLNRQKTSGQSTVPVVASQVNRLHSHVSEGQRMNDLYKAIQAIENKEV